jgi:ferredoxin
VTGIATVLAGHRDDAAVAEAEADCPARAIRLSRP